MHKIQTLEVKLMELRKKYSDKYFIFIAPKDITRWDEINLLDCIKKKKPIDYRLIDENIELEIFFIEHNKIENSKNKMAIGFKRYTKNPAWHIL